MTQALTAPPSRCCDTGERCWASPMIDASSCALEISETLGAPGSVWDGATGDCVPAPGTGGPCCALAGDYCGASPVDGPEICAAAGGTYLATGVCGPAGSYSTP